jgi:hypothetical protein
MFIAPAIDLFPALRRSGTTKLTRDYKHFASTRRGVDQAKSRRLDQNFIQSVLYFAHSRAI